MAEEAELTLCVREIAVHSEDTAPAGFLGSPTVLVAGVDVEPAARERKGPGFG